MQDRIKKLLFRLFFFAAAGACYFFFGQITGWWIPCPLKLLTGFFCPGCGVTRMAVALLRLDFADAFRSNPLLLLLLPVLAMLFLQLAVRYVRSGAVQLTRTQNRLVWMMAVCLLAFGVLRNIPAFYILRPLG